VIVSADSDFGELLAASRGATRPSVVLLRSVDRLTSEEQAALLALAFHWYQAAERRA
jgi:predicted nuclease of predicted toxin-antitoxin system